MNRKRGPAGAKLLEEHLEHDNQLGTVKYTGKFMLDNLEKVFAKGNFMEMFEAAQRILPDCFNGCLEKMFAHGQKNDIKTNCIGFILRSDKIPFGGEICEPIKPDVDLYDLVERVQDKLGDLNVDLKGRPFTVIVNGIQKGGKSSPSLLIDANGNDNTSKKAKRKRKRKAAKKNARIQDQALVDAENVDAEEVEALKLSAKIDELELKSDKDDINDLLDLEQLPDAILLDERFEQNVKFRLVKYIGHFTMVNSMNEIANGDKREKIMSDFNNIMGGIAPKIYRKCFRECLDKMMSHGEKHGIKPNRIGFIVNSPEIIPSGEICEPIKPNSNFDDLINRIEHKLVDLDVTFEMMPFMVTVTGTEI